MKIRIGLGSCGMASGGNKVMEKIKKELKDSGSDVIVEPTGCIGLCFYEPIVDVLDGDEVYTYANS